MMAVETTLIIAKMASSAAVVNATMVINANERKK